MKLNLNSLDDWLNINQKKIIQNGGRILIRIYRSDYKLLLSSLYPDHHWNFNQFKIKLNKKIYFDTIDQQKSFLDQLFIKFKLKSMNDWLHVSTRKIIEKGGRKLLDIYYHNFRLVLCSLIF